MEQKDLLEKNAELFLAASVQYKNFIIDNLLIDILGDIDVASKGGDISIQWEIPSKFRNFLSEEDKEILLNLLRKRKLYVHLVGRGCVICISWS